MSYVNKKQEEYGKQEILKQFRFSVTKFDEISEVHEFSERYERRKEMLLKEYNEEVVKKVKRVPFRVAVIAATICIIGTAGIYAAVTHDEFLNGAFGNSSRKSVPSHAVIHKGNDKDKEDVAVQMPAREYIAVDTEVAEKYIGDYIIDEPLTKNIGEHTLTILSAVRDQNVMVMEFTLERKGGENALKYNDTTNATKGAYFSDDADIAFSFVNGSDCIYVDMAKSTDERLYCYDYVVFDEILEEGKTPILNIMSADKPLIEAVSIISDTFIIPLTKVVPSVKYTSAKGGVLEASVLGLSTDMAKGLGLKGIDSKDPGNIKSIKINYNDETEYVVYADNVWNEGYSCTFGSTYRAVFNRLVDIDKINTIEINGIDYTVE